MFCDKVPGMEDKEYVIHRMILERGRPRRKDWSSIDALSVDCYPWNTLVEPPIPAVLIPRMKARLLYSQEGIHILMEAQERYPRATYHESNSPVCKDSCQEFFLQPCPDEDGRYFNFEFNPWGTMHLGIGHDRYDRTSIEPRDTGNLGIRSRIGRSAGMEPGSFHWVIELSIPFGFIQGFFPTFRVCPGKTMRGNIYKCGDDTLHPHFGCWNPIVHATPDFHRPEHFGRLVLE
jgi:hypothetical protein